MKKNKKKKRKISIKGLLLLILALYLFIMGFYYVFNININSIIIKNNNYVTDNEIIEAAKLNNASIFKTSSLSIKKRIKKLDFIDNVTVKKNIFGKLIISVDEAKILFYNNTNNLYTLSNLKEVELDNEIIGIPTLINYVPDDIYQSFIKELAKVDYSIVQMISEIEYKPDISGDVTIDDTRFLLKMNDGNSVYVNVINLEKLNRYKEAIISVYDQGRGILYLDSNSSNNLFRTYDKIVAEEEIENVEEQKDQTEESDE